MLNPASTTSDIQRPSNLPKDYSPSSRIEPIPRPDFPHDKYPRWIGHKFTPTGIVLPFPGNTVICHLPPTSVLHAQLTSLQHRLAKYRLAPALALLPPSSYHMTFYEGISYPIPTPTTWPSTLPLECSLPTCHAHVISTLSTLRLSDTEKPPYKLRITAFEPLTDGVALKLAPISSSEEARMRSLREKMASAVGVRQPGFEEYSFHLSIGYLLRWLDEAETRELQGVLNEWLRDLGEVGRQFELGTPEVCVYDDMEAFRRVFLLE